MIVRDCQHVSHGWSKYKLGIVKNLVRDSHNVVMECLNFCQGLSK